MIEISSSIVWSSNDVVDEAADKTSDRVFGSFNINKNVTSWMVGTMSIRRSVAFDVKPMLNNPAYVKDPVIPAAPVPEAQATITFLLKQNQE